MADLEIHKLLKLMGQHDASDLHIKVNEPPVFRVNGSLSRMQKVPKLNAENTQQLLLPMLNEDQTKRLKQSGNVDFGYPLEGVGRFRVNVFMQRGNMSAAIRRVNTHIPTYDELGLPPQITRIAPMEQGLVLIGGITGSGKSTTLAAILDDINSRRRAHILTIEDPIEYLFEDNLAIINQREIGIDITDFKESLRAAVRQDPDVILIGEMRDAETFETALTAAETGHLVFGSIHSSSSAQTIDRILDLFPTERHPQIRKGLGFNMRCIMNQKLLRGSTRERPRVPAMEVMFNTPIIRKMILDGEDKRIPEAIKMDTDNGCESYNESLVKLYRQKLISEEVAVRASPNAEELRMSMRGISISDSGGIV